MPKPVPWTAEEEELLRKLTNAGQTMPQIAIALQRSKEAVRARGLLLGLRPGFRHD